MGVPRDALFIIFDATYIYRPHNNNWQLPLRTDSSGIIYLCHSNRRHISRIAQIIVIVAAISNQYLLQKANAFFYPVCDVLYFFFIELDDPHIDISL